MLEPPRRCRCSASDSARRRCKCASGRPPSLPRAAAVFAAEGSLPPPVPVSGLGLAARLRVVHDKMGARLPQDRRGSPCVTALKSLVFHCDRGCEDRPNRGGVATRKSALNLDFRFDHLLETVGRRRTSLLVRVWTWQVHGHPRAGGLGGSGWGFLGTAVHGRRQKSAWLSPTGGVRESKTEISVEDTRYAGASAYWLTYGGLGIALLVPLI